MVELSFKVFPEATARVTCAIDCPDLADALDRLGFLCCQTWEVEAAELILTDAGPRLLVRFMGDEPALTARAEAALAAIGRGGRILSEDEAAAVWKPLASLETGKPGAPLARVPLTPSRIPPLEAALAGTGTTRHYGMAGNVALISGMEAAELDAVLRREELTGLMLRGDGPARIGLRPAALMESKVKAAMDATGKFPVL